SAPDSDAADEARSEDAGPCNEPERVHRGVRERVPSTQHSVLSTRKAGITRWERETRLAAALGEAAKLLFAVPLCFPSSLSIGRASPPFCPSSWCWPALSPCAACRSRNIRRLRRRP